MGRVLPCLLAVGCLCAIAIALADPPDAAKAHFNAGFAAMGANDLDTAIGELRQAIEVDRGYLDAHWFLGWAYSLKGDQEHAAEQYRAIIDLAPDSDRAGEAKAALERLEPAGAEAKTLTVSPAAAPARPVDPAQLMAALRLLGEPTAVSVLHIVSDNSPKGGAEVVAQVWKTAQEMMPGKNLADGLPAAAAATAGPVVAGGHEMLIQATAREAVDWEKIVALLGPPETEEEQPTDLDLGLGIKGYPVIWCKYGWLYFGRVEGPVRVVRADLRTCPRNAVAPPRVAADQGDRRAALLQELVARADQRKAAGAPMEALSLLRSAQVFASTDSAIADKIAGITGAVFDITDQETMTFLRDAMWQMAESDLWRWPAVTGQYDEAELKILLEPKATGNGLFTTIQPQSARQTGVVSIFVTRPSLTAAEATELFGEPQERRAPNDRERGLMTYGRMRLMVNNDGHIACVLRHTRTR